MYKFYRERTAVGIAGARIKESPNQRSESCQGSKHDILDHNGEDAEIIHTILARFGFKSTFFMVTRKVPRCWRRNKAFLRAPVLRTELPRANSCGNVVNRAMRFVPFHPRPKSTPVM